MSKEKINSLEKDLSSVQRSIEFLIEKLINLAIWENKFIEKYNNIKQIETKLLQSQSETTEKCEAVIGRIRKIENTYKFRFQWMEKLFLKVTL